jgi:curved DNA binding protein
MERDEREEEETLSTPGVIEKYQISAKIVNEVLGRLLKKIAVGSKIFELCLWSDSQIYEELSKVYNKKPTFKGLAFPTTISVNEVCGYNSPLQEDSTSIKEGDLVKIELGVHIDGFAAFVGHTVVVQSDKNAPITGKKADVILAAYKAAQAALRLLKPGHFNNQVTEVIQKVCDSYQVAPLEGVLSHELKKHLIDGNKVIINKETFEQRVDAQEFAIHDVFALDVFVSSGEGKPKESDLRCTVYKRALDRSYNLKIKQSRQFFNEVLDRYPSFCFSLNSFEDPIAARIGIKECLEHELLVPFPILVEKPGNFVAQFKFTVMITKGKTTALTGLPIDEALFKTENSIKEQQVLDLLAVRSTFNLVVDGQVGAEEGEEETAGSQAMMCISIFNHKINQLFICILLFQL